MTTYYVYAYCDPRVHADISCEGFAFEYEPFYIGEGCGLRRFVHLNQTMNTQKVKRINAIRQTEQLPIINVLLEGLTKEEARNIEKRLIAQIGTVKVINGIKRGPLTNLNVGGGGVRTHSEETKRKMSAARLGKKHDPKTLEKMSKTKKSKIYSDETRIGLSKGRKGKSHSQETKLLIGNKSKGRRMPLLVKEKMRDIGLQKRWVVKNGKPQKIDMSMLEHYISLGYRKGRK